MCARAATRTAVQALEAAGADVIVATGQNEPARLGAALDELGARGIQSILLEGGPHLAGTFFDVDEIDELRLFVAPVIAGGGEARCPSWAARAWTASARRAARFTSSTR